MAEKLRFSDEHLWVRLEAGVAYIGLSEHLQNELGEIVSVQLPEGGEEIERGEPLGEIESTSEVRELISPITGVVVAANTELEERPTLVNEDPYQDGWLIEVEPRDEAEIDELMEPDEYEELVAGEDEEE